MGKIVKTRDGAPTSEYRALTMFEDLPAGHKAVLVRQTGFEPHLRLGEFAVVDMTDKDVVKDELYMIWNRSGINGPELAIVQASLRPYENLDGKFIGVGWRYAFKRPGTMPFGEGPYRLEAWPEKCFGRVVGVFAPLMTHLDTCGSSLPESIFPKAKRLE